MMGVRFVIDWGRYDGKRRERPGAVFAGYADLCEGLVAGERRRKECGGRGRGRALCALRHGCELCVVWW